MNSCAAGESNMLFLIVALFVLTVIGHFAR